MVGHREHALTIDVAGGSQQTDAVLFVEVRIVDERQLETQVRLRPERAPNRLTLEAGNDDRLLDASTLQGAENANDQRHTSDYTKGLRKHVGSFTQSRPGASSKYDGPRDASLSHL
jgi:hypothetical protein